MNFLYPPAGSREHIDLDQTNFPTDGPLLTRRAVENINIASI